MNKVSLLLMSILLLVVLAACGAESDKATGKEEDTKGERKSR